VGCFLDQATRGRSARFSLKVSAGTPTGASFEKKPQGGQIQFQAFPELFDQVTPVGIRNPFRMIHKGDEGGGMGLGLGKIVKFDRPVTEKGSGKFRIRYRGPVSVGEI